MILSWKFRIEPNRAQATALGAMLFDFFQLYNAALEERIGAWRRGVSLNYRAQAAHLPPLRRDMSDTHGRWSCSA